MKRRQGYVTRQAQRLSAGDINRRRFVMSALGAGVTLPTALSLASRAEARTPRPGGVLRYATMDGGPEDSPDPARATNQFLAVLAQARGNGLTEIANTGDLVPALAEAFEPEDGFRNWAFTLRPGVTFHDGKPLTAEDVAATMAHASSASAHSGTRALLADVLSVRAESQRRVVFELAEACVEFPRILADHRLTIQASEGRRVVPGSFAGTGAYVLREFTPGRRAVLTKNPDYWRTGRGHFDRIEIAAIPDATTRQNAVLAGDVDFIDAVDPGAMALLARCPTLEILETAGTGHCGIAMCQDTAPFGDARLRNALQYAIDRQALVDQVLLGHGVAGNDVPVPQGAVGLSQDLPVRAFDPEQAASLFARSGHSGPVPLKLDHGAAPDAGAVARLLVCAAAQAGIELRVLRAQRAVSVGPGLSAAGWARPGTTGGLHALAQAQRAAAWQGTETSQRFERLIAEAGAEPDPERRGILSADAQRLFQAEAVALVAFWANDIHAHVRTLAHDDAVATHLPADGARIAERWWFA